MKKVKQYKSKDSDYFRVGRKAYLVSKEGTLYIYEVGEIHIDENKQPTIYYKHTTDIGGVNYTTGPMCTECVFSNKRKAIQYIKDNKVRHIQNYNRTVRMWETGEPIIEGYNE